MRISIASTSVAALLVLSVMQVAGQRGAGAGLGAGAGDDSGSGSGSDEAITYTTGGVVYTAEINANGNTVSRVPIETLVAAAATTTAANANNAGGVSNPSFDTIDDVAADNEDAKQSSPSRLLQFQQFERRSLDKLNPDQPTLDKRQAALGGGAGAVTTQTGLQTISGYNPPANTQVPTPTNYGSGTIISASQIPGYTGAGNSQTGSTGSGAVSSGVSKLTVGKLALGCLTGAAIGMALV